MKTPRPAPKFSVAAAPDTELGSTINVTADGELMTNYQAVAPVAPGHRIAAAQDQQGNPMLFSIGGDGHLYLIGQAPGTASGWVQLDLSAQLGAELYALSFGLAQARDGSLFLAVALAPSSADTSSSTLYIANALPNDPQDSAWQDMSARWVARAAVVSLDPSGSEDLGSPAISRILIGDALDSSSTPIMIAVASVAGEAQHYFVNADPNDTTWSWKPYPLPLDAATVLDLAIGCTPLGIGTYALCVDPSGNQTTLTFTSVPDQYGQTYNRQFQTPPGARSLAVIADPDDYGYSQLFVGGDGLFWFPSTGQSSNAAAVTILDASPGGSVFELQVRQDRRQIVIWWNDSGEDLYYVQGRQTNVAAEADWSTPLVLRSQVTQIAAYCNQPRQTAAIFYVTGGATLGLMYQADTSTLWKDTPIPLSDTGEVDSFTCYTSQIQLTRGDNGAPLANVEVRISASELSYTTVNGNLYVLAPGQWVNVTTDPTGTLTCINRVTDISTPVYSIDADFLTAPLVLNPASKVIAGLAGIQTADDLQNAKNQDGSPVITGDYPDEVYEYAAYSITQVNSMLAQLPANGAPATSGSPEAKQVAREQTWGMLLGEAGPRLYTGVAVGTELLPALGGRAQPQGESAKLDLGVIDWVEGVFGDVMQALETGVEEVFGFVVSAVEEVFQFVVKIGEMVIKVIVKSLAEALKLACWILDELFGLDLLAFLQWLGFLFSWGDIIDTHAVLANMANQSLNLVVAELGQAEGKIVRFFQDLKRRLEGLPALPESIASLTVSAVVDSTTQETSADNQANAQFITSSAVGNFSNYQVQYSGMLDTPATGAESGSGPVVTFFTKVLVPTVKQAAALLEGFVADLVSISKGVLAGTMTIGEAIETIVNDTLIDLLSLCEVLAVGLVEVAESLVTTLEDILNAPIQIPFLTALYKLISGDDEMTLLNGLALLAAIPTTIFYKLVTDEAPFADGDYGLATGDYQEVFSTLGITPPSPASARVTPTLSDAATDSSGSTGNRAAQEIYSTVGGAAALCAKLFSSVLDGINALAKNEVKFTSELEMISSLIQLGGTFPVGNDDETVANLCYGSWAIGIMDVLVDFCVYLTPREAKVEMGTFVQGPYILLSTTVQLGLAIAVLVELCQQDSGIDLEWDVEGFVEELCYAVAGYFSGIAKIDPDPVTEAIEDVGAVACTLLGIFLGAIRDIYDMKNSDVFAPA